MKKTLKVSGGNECKIFNAHTKKVFETGKKGIDAILEKFNMKFVSIPYNLFERQQ